MAAQLLLLLPLLAGLTLNTLNDKPKNFDDVKASVVKQLKNPVKAPGGPYNK